MRKSKDFQPRVAQGSDEIDVAFGPDDAGETVDDSVEESEAGGAEEAAEPASSYNTDHPTPADLKRVQALLKRPDRANTIILKLDDPRGAQDVAAVIERRFGYNSVSWQEASEDLMSTLATRNIIMYTVVSAGLSVPSSTRMLADRLTAATVDALRARGDDA